MFQYFSQLLFSLVFVLAAQLSRAESIVQLSQGTCSPNLSYIEGPVSIICADTTAIAAIETLVQQMETLALSDQEKTAIISDQAKTIARLVAQKMNSEEPDRYDEALKAIAAGDKFLADELLSMAINDAENQFQDQLQKTIQLYIERGALWFASDTEKALIAYLRANELNPNNLSVINQLGKLYYRSGNLIEAEKHYQSLGYLSGDLEWQAISNGNLGTVYQTQSDLDKAVKYYERALSIYEKLGSQYGMAGAYGNLGNVYQTRGDLDNAIEYYDRSLTINERLGSEERMGINYANFGIVYEMRGDLDKAFEYYERSFSIYKKLGHQEGIADQYVNLGSLHRIRGDLDKAIEYYERSLSIYEKLGRLEGIATNYGNIGIVYQKREDLDKAIIYYELSLSINEKLGRQEGIWIRQ